MNLNELMRPVSNRLQVFFPPKSFVLIDLKPGSSGKGGFADREWIDYDLKRLGYQFAYPPNLEGLNRSRDEIYILEQNSEAYWEYFFPGLRSIHRRKSGILISTLINGINYRQAGELILRKLNIDHNNKAHLLLFEDGKTLHYAGDEVQDPDYLAKLMLNHAHTNLRISRGEENKSNKPAGYRYLNHIFFKQLGLENNGDFDLSAVGEDQAFFQDEDVVKTLTLIKETENQFGFYKILRYLIQQQISNTGATLPLNPELNKWVTLTNVQRAPELYDYGKSITFHHLEISIRLQPLDYAIYKLYWNNPDGIELKNLYLHRDELKNLYQNVSASLNMQQINQTIDDLLKPTDFNSRMNQALSRIKARFKAQTPEEFFTNYIIKGPRGGVYKIEYRGQDQ